MAKREEVEELNRKLISLTVRTVDGQEEEDPEDISLLGEEEEQIACPVDLLLSEEYREMTSDARIVYLLMLYRLKIWPSLDEDGEQYILMPMSLIIQQAGFSKKRMFKAIRELEEYDLILKRKHRQCSTQIYIKNLRPALYHRQILGGVNR